MCHAIMFMLFHLIDLYYVTQLIPHEYTSIMKWLSIIYMDGERVHWKLFFRGNSYVPCSMSIDSEIYLFLPFHSTHTLTLGTITKTLDQFNTLYIEFSDATIYSSGPQKPNQFKSFTFAISQLVKKYCKSI